MRMYAVLKTTVLNGDINSTQTTISVDSANHLPSLSPGQYLVILVNDRFKTEIMHCTEIDGTDLTVTRGQKDGKIYSFSSGSYVQISIDPEGFEF